MLYHIYSASVASDFAPAISHTSAKNHLKHMWIAHYATHIGVSVEQKDIYIFIDFEWYFQGAT